MLQVLSHCLVALFTKKNAMTIILQVVRPFLLQGHKYKFVNFFGLV